MWPLLHRLTFSPLSASPVGHVLKSLAICSMRLICWAKYHTPFFGSATGTANMRMLIVIIFIVCLPFCTLLVSQVNLDAPTWRPSTSMRQSCIPLLRYQLFLTCRFLFSCFWFSQHSLTFLVDCISMPYFIRIGAPKMYFYMVNTRKKQFKERAAGGKDDAAPKKKTTKKE